MTPRDAAGRSEARPNATDLPALSAVVIARNEADRIRACLESVFDATDPFEAEVLVVDSNSTDRTVARAAEFPAAVFRIPDDDLSTPAAGRYVGGRLARGEQVLFVDGDMVLDGGWLEPAARLLAARPSLAGVGGYLDETDATAAEAAEWLNGVALYDAEALAEVGGFDPYLRALEDVHLGFELTAADYRLLRFPTAVSDHDRASSGLLEPVRRWRRGFFHGVADALFRSASSPRLLAKHLVKLRFPVAAGLWVLAGLASLLALPAFGLWLSATLVGLAAMVRAQGVERTYRLLALWLFLWTAVLTHEWRAPPDREAYPLDRIERVAPGPRLPAESGQGSRVEPR